MSGHDCRRRLTPPLQSDVDRLILALLGGTALTADLQQLTDVIGGRATGSPSNERSIDWALGAFKAAGVEARRESFGMPGRWLEKLATAVVAGAASFSPRVAAMPSSVDFLLEGVPNLVANQESANYGPSYHSRADRERPRGITPATGRTLRHSSGPEFVTVDRRGNVFGGEPRPRAPEVREGTVSPR